MAHGRVERVTGIGVWAPGAIRVRALVAGEPVELVAGEDGWWSGANAPPGTDYAFLLDDSDEPVTIDLAVNQVRFTFGAIELVSKLVEGKFPDYQRVIPSGYTKSFSIGRDDWLRSLQRVAILTSDKFKGVRFVLSEDAVKISSTNADQEDAQDEIEIAYPHGTLDIGFNVSYLLDVLNNLKTEQVTVAVGDSNSSALITLPENQDFKYVVMPMRI